MKIKKLDILKLFSAIKKAGDHPGVKFAYALAKNANILKSEVEAINASEKPSKEFEKVNDEWVKLAEKFAEKDKKGHPKKIATHLGDGMIFTELVIKDQNACDSAFEEFKEKHKEVYAARDKQLEEYKKSLEEEIDVKLYKIKIADVPDGVTGNQLDGIYLILED